MESGEWREMHLEGEKKLKACSSSIHVVILAYLSRRHDWVMTSE